MSYISWSSVASGNICPVEMWGVAGSYTSEPRSLTIITNGIFIQGTATVEWLTTLFGDMSYGQNCIIQSKCLVGNLGSNYTVRVVPILAGPTEYSYYSIQARAAELSTSRFYIKHVVDGDVVTANFTAHLYSWSQIENLSPDLSEVYIAVKYINQTPYFGYWYNNTWYDADWYQTYTSDYQLSDSTIPALVYPNTPPRFYGMSVVTPIYVSTRPYVYILPNEKGVAVSSSEIAEYGDIITVTITPNQGESIDRDNVTLTSSAAILPVWDSENTFHFQIEFNPVIIKLAFVETPPIKWVVWVSGTYGGLVTVDKFEPDNGEEVTMTFFVESGYELNKAATSVVANGRQLPITWVSDTVAMFNAPTSSPSS